MMARRALSFAAVPVVPASDFAAGDEVVVAAVAAVVVHKEPAPDLMALDKAEIRASVAEEGISPSAGAVAASPTTAAESPPPDAASLPLAVAPTWIVPGALAITAALAIAAAARFPVVPAGASVAEELCWMACCTPSGVAAASGPAARASSRAAKGSVALSGVNPWVCCCHDDAVAVAALT